MAQPQQKIWIFFKSFFKDFKHTGSILPSSKHLTNKMLKGVDFSKPCKILELGPGTGCMTHEILSRMHPESELVCIEINPSFCENLRALKTDKQLRIIEASALDFEKHLSSLKFDAVISGLPLANFTSQEIDMIFNNIQKSLSKDGKYIQFQYTLRNDRLIKSRFSKVSKNYSLFNFPPAFVYTCSL